MDNEKHHDEHEAVGPEPHGFLVDAWMRRAQELDPAARFDLFERAFIAVWARARVPLGGITLVAGLDRVLVNARERYPALASVTVDASGLEFSGLRACARSLSQEELLDILRFLLVEFLGLLGSLTGELITPALHATLWSVDLGTEPETSNRRHDEGKPLR
jgi:hypothetical protein